MAIFGGADSSQDLPSMALTGLHCAEVIHFHGRFQTLGLTREQNGHHKIRGLAQRQCVDAGRLQDVPPPIDETTRIAAQEVGIVDAQEWQILKEGGGHRRRHWTQP